MRTLIAKDSKATEERKGTDVETKPRAGLLSGDISVGDRVRAVDNYRGNRGRSGTVIKVTRTQVTIKPTDGGETFRKYKHNVRLIE